MAWLNPANIEWSGRDEETEAAEREESFLSEHGDLGYMTLSIFSSVNPMRFARDEYIGYAERFIKEAGKYLPTEWNNYPGLAKELVRRSFYPTQVLPSTDGYVWVSEEHISAIADSITQVVRESGGWEKFFPVD